MPAITPYPGDLIDVAQAAALCGVSEVTVRSWVNRGYQRRDGGRGHVRIVRRDHHPETGRPVNLLDPVEVAKADEATRERARRHVVRDTAA